MNVRDINQALKAGSLATPGLFPHLDALEHEVHVFRPDFGLDELPEAPGVLLIRGPRQYGKSTWLEDQLRSTIASAGPSGNAQNRPVGNT